MKNELVQGGISLILNVKKQDCQGGGGGGGVITFEL